MAEYCGTSRDGRFDDSDISEANTSKRSDTSMHDDSLGEKPCSSSGLKRKFGSSSGPQESGRSSEHSGKVTSISSKDSPRKDAAQTAAEEASNAKHNKEKTDRMERMKMQRLVTSFSEDQLNRYEMYRRSSFPKASIKRFMQTTAGYAVSQNVVIAIAGVSKVFVGEIMELALDVLEQKGEKPPVKPEHIREAIRKLKARRTYPYNKPKTSPF